MNKFDRRWESVRNHYFDYNGERYYAGTRFTTDYSYYKNIPAFFVGNNPYNENECNIRMTIDCRGRTVGINVPREKMGEHINEIIEGNHYVETSAKIRYFRDVDIPELFLGWIAYIVIMLVLFIFNDRWLGWFVVSAYFFHWRKGVKEENIYVEEDNK